MSKKKKSSSTASKALALGTALSLGTFGFTAIGTGAAFGAPTANTAAASLNTTKVIKLANGKTRIRVDLADNLRGKTVFIRTSRMVDGKRVVVTLGRVTLNRAGQAVLTVSRKIRVDDRLVVTDGIRNIVNSKITVIDDRTPVVPVPTPTPTPAPAPAPAPTPDTTAPTYTSAAISNANKTVTLTFSEGLVNNTADAAALKAAITFASDGTTFVALGGSDTVSITGSTIVVVFNSALTGSTNAIRVASNTLKDAAGNVLESSATTSAITAADIAAPTLNSSTPADDATGVTVGANIVLTFSEAVKSGTGDILIKRTTGGSTVETIAVASTTISGSTVTINPTADLLPGTGYYIEFASGVILDLANNSYAGIVGATTLNFTTLADTAAYDLLVTEVGALIEADYTTASWALYEAEVIDLTLDDQNTQAEVDAAAAAIQGALDLLVEVADTAAYDLLVTEVGALIEADYTTASWALYEAEVIDLTLDDQNTQAEVDAAAAAIQGALDLLVEVADTAAYDLLVTEVGALIEADYTTASWALYEAEVIDLTLDDQNTQAEVDAAAAAIQGALDLLELVPVV